MRVLLPMRLLLSCAALLACHPRAALCAPRAGRGGPLRRRGLGRRRASRNARSRSGALGTVGPGGGAVDRLWFATTGDTRPAECDQTNAYPKAAIAQIAAAMKALRVQFNAGPRRSHVRLQPERRRGGASRWVLHGGGRARPSAWWMTWAITSAERRVPVRVLRRRGHPMRILGVHGRAPAAAALLRQRRADVARLARFVVIADDSWNATQSRLAARDADRCGRARQYTIVARHTRPGPYRRARDTQCTAAAQVRADPHRAQSTSTSTTPPPGRAAPPWWGSAAPGANGDSERCYRAPMAGLVFRAAGCERQPIGAPWRVGSALGFASGSPSTISRDLGLRFPARLAPARR